MPRDTPANWPSSLSTCREFLGFRQSLVIFLEEITYFPWIPYGTVPPGLRSSHASDSKRTDGGIYVHEIS